MTVFTRDDLATLARGSDELNRMKREIEMVTKLVGNFLLPQIQYAPVSYNISPPALTWQFVLTKHHEIFVELTEKMPWGSGSTTLYSSKGVAAVMGNTKTVHDSLVHLIDTVLNFEPQFRHTIKPLLDAGRLK